MHTTTTHINTTFERAEVGLGSFLFAIWGWRPGQGSSGWDLGRGWGSGLGGCLVLGLAFWPSWDRLDCLGSRSLASVPGSSVGEGCRAPTKGSWPGGVQC
ncbi:hypothetical protein AMECASPLE_036733 [Ameca splendens]|uniref:Uncharacterized protein n=1 Tax=Ameca splendens TaxID=208324 RepID=A0ABV1A5N0_9TELE